MAQRDAATTPVRALPPRQPGRCHHTSPGQLSNSPAEQPPRGVGGSDLVGNSSPFIRIFPRFYKSGGPRGRLAGPTQLAHC